MDICFLKIYFPLDKSSIQNFKNMFIIWNFENTSYLHVIFIYGLEQHPVMFMGSCVAIDWTWISEMQSMCSGPMIQCHLRVTLDVVLRSGSAERSSDVEYAVPGSKFRACASPLSQFPMPPSYPGQCSACRWSWRVSFFVIFWKGPHLVELRAYS